MWNLIYAFLSERGEDILLDVIQYSVKSWQKNVMKDFANDAVLEISKNH
jgi:hypothetical protein